MRRASVSIMWNIAEGFESRTPALFVEYPGRAKASAGELPAHLYVAQDVGYLVQSQYEQMHELVDKCSCQLSKFMTYLVSQKAKNV